MYPTPSLTTVRQPLHRMGQTAAQLLLRRIQFPQEAYPETVMFEPELMVRESTAAAGVLPGVAAGAEAGARAPRKPVGVAKKRLQKT
jgi:LacI family transcriptional regulator